MSVRLLSIFTFSIILSGCTSQPKYDIDTVAQISGHKNRLGAPQKSAKCSFIQAQTGETEGVMRSGLCVAFNSAFVFRSIDINNPLDGNSIIFYYSILNGAGVTPPNFLGVKQLVLSTNVSSNGFMFKPTEGIGYNNDMAFEFIGFLKAKNIKEIKEPKSIGLESSGGTTYIINTVNRKKK